MSLGPNSTVIDVKNILGTNYSNSSGSYLTRAVAYGTVDKRTYYDGMMVDFSWASGSSSSLANYKGEELCSKFLRLGMLAWDIALMQDWGKGLNALGFVNL